MYYSIPTISPRFCIYCNFIMQLCPFVTVRDVYKTDVLARWGRTGASEHDADMNIENTLKKTRADTFYSIVYLFFRKCTIYRRVVLFKCMKQFVFVIHTCVITGSNKCDADASFPPKKYLMFTSLFTRKRLLSPLLVHHCFFALCHC